MIRPRVLLTRKIPSSILALLTDRCDVDLHDGDGGLPRDDLKRRVADKDALIRVLTDKIDGEIMDAGPALKVDREHRRRLQQHRRRRRARQRGIIVTNTPDVLTEAVAELHLGADSRHRAPRRRRRAADPRGGWKGWALDFMLGTELRGKQLGIVGGGRIGRAVAAKAPAFGMRVAVRRQARPVRRRDVARRAAGDVGRGLAARAARRPRRVI